MEKILYKKQVLITGGLGFIGASLVRRLLELGAQVTLVDGLIPKYRGNLFNIAGIEDKVRVNISDVRDEHSMKYLVQGQGYLYVASLPTVVEAPSFVFVQRPYAYGYNTEYLGWCLNKVEFLACAREEGLELVREFVFGQQPFIHGALEQNEYRGFLFRAQPRNGL